MTPPAFMIQSPKIHRDALIESALPRLLAFVHVHLHVHESPPISYLLTPISCDELRRQPRHAPAASEFHVSIDTWNSAPGLMISP
jgi:hypothetical protein